MLTLQELKQITGRPEQSDKTPSAKYLERHDTVVAVRRLDTDTNITVYKSGYALYRVCSRATVFSLFQCRKYLYESENEEISIGESFFDRYLNIKIAFHIVLFPKNGLFWRIRCSVLLNR